MKILHGLKKVAVLCVLKHKYKFLLLKRDREPNKGSYTPIGGKIDPFESPHEAAIRECFEETGIRIEKFRYKGLLTETSASNYNWINFVYLAEIEDINPPHCSEGILEWVHFDQVLELPTPNTDWYIYNYIIKSRNFALNAIYDQDLRITSMTEDIQNIVII